MAQAIFLSGSLMRHVAVMSLTSSVGILAIFAVDFVDMIFIAMLGQSELAAAIGYAGTLLFFTNAVNIGLSIAAGTLVAQALGRDEEAAAREHATAVGIFALITSVVIPALLLPNLSAVLGLLGAEGETLAYAQSYCAIILPTMCLMGLAMTAMAVLRAHGNARASMAVTLIGGVVNAVLDPLLIFGLGLGLEGAAYASVLARLTMAVCSLAYVIRAHNGFKKPSLGLIRRDFRAVSALAGPAVLTNLATPIGTAIVTREMAKFGTEAVAAMAVIGRLTPLAFAVVLALSGAIGPIVGQNFGAERMDRVRGALVAGLQFLTAYVVVVTLILIALRAPIADLFEAQGEMRQLIYLFCGPLALFQIVNGAIFVCNASFNNLGHPLYSTAVNLGRNTLGTWPFVLIGAHLAGASGVLIGQALGGVVFALIAVVMAWRLTGQSQQCKAADDFASQKRIHQVTTRRNW